MFLAKLYSQDLLYRLSPPIPFQRRARPLFFVPDLLEARQPSQPFVAFLKGDTALLYRQDFPRRAQGAFSLGLMGLNRFQKRFQMVFGHQRPRNRRGFSAFERGIGVPIGIMRIRFACQASA